MHVILWDIDGTLLRSNGGRVAVNAFLRALSSSCMLESEPLYPRDSSGKTDPQIALDILAAAAIEDARVAEALTGFPAAYLQELQQQREALSGDLRVLPGVTSALEQLRNEGAIQSLLTGNLLPVARLKLGCAGLDSYVDFELGAYGSDHADRTCLVPVVRERLRQRFGDRASQAELVVVGDTPRDIECARAGSARAIAVATGNYSRQELAACAPDAVLDDLADTDAVIQTLLR